MSPAVTLASAQARCTEALSTQALYTEAQAHGIDLGPMFQGVSAVWAGGNERLGRIALPTDAAAEAESFAIHPALLDAAMQVGATLLPAPSAGGRVFLPVGADRIVPHADTPTHGDVFWSHAVMRSSPSAAATVDVTLFDSSGQVLLVIEALRFQAVAPVGLTTSTAPEQGAVYEIAWRSAPQTAMEARPAGWLLCAAEHDAAAASLVTQLRAAGQDCLRVTSLAQAVVGGDERGVLVLAGSAQLGGSEVPGAGCRGPDAGTPRGSSPPSRGDAGRSWRR